MGGYGRSQKNFFRHFGPKFGLKIRGGGGWVPRAPFLDPPLKSFEKRLSCDTFVFIRHVQTCCFLVSIFLVEGLGKLAFSGHRTNQNGLVFEGKTFAPTKKITLS